MSTLRPVVLSGGAGTRLWPLSTSRLPKQFAPLIEGRTLFDLTLARLRGIPGVADPIVVTGAVFADMVLEAAREAGIRLSSVIIEPVGRNTAPAALAAAHAAGADETLVIVPSDHLIGDEEGFCRAVSVAAEHAAQAGGIVTFGIRPTRPETGYGYIETGEAHGEVFEMARFKEKPTVSEAEDLMADGRHLWNSGMFVVTVESLLTEAAEVCPKLLAGVRAALPELPGDVVYLDGSFAAVEAISIDYAIMERTRRAYVLPVDVGWDDVGSFISLLASSRRDERGNHVEGDVVLRDVGGSFVKATSRKVVVAGVEDMVVVETPEVVLVVPLDRSQEVRDIQMEVEGG